MFDLDKWQEIFNTLAKNPFRTGLTAFGVFWGIMMLVLMLGAGNGLQNGATVGFSGTATNSFFVWTRSTSKPFKGLPPGRRFEMNNSDVQAIRENVKEVRVLAPRNQLGGYMGGNNVTRGTESGAFSVMGDYPAIAFIQSLIISNGRFLNEFDLGDKRKVAVIGTKVQDVLFKPNEDPIGKEILIQGVYFRVIGVFKSRQTGDQADRAEQTVYIPFTTFQQAFNYGDVVGWFAITSKDGIPASVAETKVLKLLAQRHRVAPDDDRAFGHWNMEEEYNKVQGVFSIISMIVWFVGIGTLFAGVIGVSNIMLIIIKERTNEIGIRRAIGASPSSIVGQIVMEAMVLTTIAGILGLALGTVLLDVASVAIENMEGTDMFRNPEVYPMVGIVSLTVLVFAGALAGVLPAYRAVSISTVDALRAE